jgi:hypothetical protein
MVEVSEPIPSEVEKIWATFGLSPQTFPIYYPIGPKPFLDGEGNQSGARGATARLEKDLSNFPHMFIGIRINNVYQLPAELTAEAVQLFRALKEWVDGEQTVSITLSQQNITADKLFQVQLTGREGENWHPFPSPYPMAGGNNIALEIERVTSYPLLGGLPILPVVRASLLAAVFRGPMRTQAPHRAIAP